MGYLGAQERRTDPKAGLIQMGARPYDSSLGNFASEDPVLGHIGIGASLNHYAYVWGNPLNRYDLNGRDLCEKSIFEFFGAGEVCLGEVVGDIAEAPSKAFRGLEHEVQVQSRNNQEAERAIEASTANAAEDFWKKYGSTFERIYEFAGRNREACTEGARTLAPGGAIIGLFFGPEAAVPGAFIGGVVGCIGTTTENELLSP